MKNKRLTEIAKKVYFSGLGRIDLNEMKAEYGLSKEELDHVISIIRNLNRR